MRGVAAHAFGDQAKPGGPASRGRQLQPPPFAQVKRAGDLEHDKGDRPVLKRLFRDGQRFGLVRRRRKQQAMRVEKGRKADGVQRLCPPAFANPQDLALACCAGRGGKADRARSTGFVDTAAAQGKGRVADS